VAYNFSFHEIVNKDKWQDIQNHFSEVFRISLCTIDIKGNMLTAPSIWGGGCDDLISSTDSHSKDCFPHFLKSPSSDWRDGYVCPAGFHNFAIPLAIKEEVIAYLIVGPIIIGKRQDYVFYEDIAKKLGLNPVSMCDMVKALKTFTFYGIKSIIDFLHDIGLYIFQFGYQNIRLKHNTAETAIMLEGVHEFYVERVLSALLDVSCSFTDAERGSIVLLNKESGELQIRAAKGLSEDIIKQTRIKVGEGLCGLAFAQNKALFIDNDTKDDDIRYRLTNEKIKNAMLLPIKANKKSIGILNVATYKDNSDKFKRHSLDTLDKLIELVETTLSDLPGSSFM
jgi:ligand-binding sensor protein/putative methionine-R-sulfoxide reductase with GAF domain